MERGIKIVDKSDVVADENFVFQHHAFANEGVTGNLAAGADAGAFLNFDECADFDIVADFATVKVGEAVNANAIARFDVGRDLAEGLGLGFDACHGSFS